MAYLRNPEIFLRLLSESSEGEDQRAAKRFYVCGIFKELVRLKVWLDSLVEEKPIAQMKTLRSKGKGEGLRETFTFSHYLSPLSFPLADVLRLTA